MAPDRRQHPFEKGDNVKNTYTWIGRGLLFLLALLMLFVGAINRFPNNIFGMVVGGWILLRFAIQWQRYRRDHPGTPKADIDKGL